MTPTEEKMYLQQQAAKLYAFQKHYGVGVKQFEELMSNEWSMIVRKLMQTALDDEKIWNLWKAYKKKRIWDFGWKDDIEYALKQALKKRQKQKENQQRLKHEQEQKKQKYYQQVYHANIIEFSDEQSPYFHERQLALQQTQQEGYQQHEKSYDVGSDVQALGAKPEQFKKLSGTLFQHQLFKEIAQCYKKTAKIVFEHQIRNSIFVPSILEFAQSSFQAVGCEQLALAMQLNDLCDTLAETSLSFCKGAIGSMCNFVDTYVLHLDRTVASIGKIMMSVGEAMIAADPTEFGTSYYTEVFEREHCNDARYVQDAMNQCKMWYQNSSFQEKVQTGTEFVTDLAVLPILLHKISSGCWGLISRARDLRALENSAALVEEFGGVVEEIVQASQPEKKIVTTIGELEEFMVSFTEAESTNVVKQAANVSSKSSISFDQVVKRLVQEGAPFENSQFQKEILIHFNEQFCKKKLVNWCDKFQNLYKDFQIIFNNNNKKLTCDLEHILTCNLKFKLNKSTGLIEGRVVGCHYGGIFESLKTNNVIQLIEECTLPCGGKGLAYKHKFGNIPEYKSIFSSSLSQEEIMQKILEVVEKKECLYFDTWFNGSKQKIHKIGQTSDGAIIEVFLLEVGKEGLFLESAFPYYEKYSKVKDLTWKK
tara:strand:- start:241 stop:2190 length:1950 start_codon:yes stop_codon:yes gene_type:complete